MKAGRRQRAFADQLDDSLQLMAGSLRAGHSLLQALDSVAREAAAPTSVEFARVINETRVGRDVGEALDETAARMDSEDFTWVAQAIAINREVGGNLAEVLDSVGEHHPGAQPDPAAGEGAQRRGQAVGHTCLMALPFGIAGFLLLTNPGYMAKFTQSLLGYGLIGIAVVLLVRRRTVAAQSRHSRSTF